MKSMKEAIELYDAIAYLESQQSLRNYIDRIVVDSRPPQRLKHIIEPWQNNLYNVLIPLFEAAAGFPRTTNQLACFITAGKGSSKTSTIAQLVSWALCFSKRPISAICAAADKEQAAILLDRIERETAHNSWMQLDIRNYEVQGPTGNLKVLSSDSSTCQGYIPDLIVCDELTFWKKRDLCDALLSGRNKRKDCVFIILSNAGILGTWQYKIWQQAGESPNWIQYAVPSFSANWMSKEAIEEDRKMLLPALYKRLYLNEWADPGVDNGYLTLEQLQTCVDQNWSYQTKGNPNFIYVMGLDGGIVGDRTAAILMHAEGDTVVLDKVDVWQPSRSNRMPISTIEAWMDNCISNFQVRSLVLDSHNLEQTAQKYERRLDVERFSFRGDSHYKMAENLRSLVVNQRLKLYPNAGHLEKADGSTDTLITEIANLITVEKNGFYRLDHRPGFHDDIYCALAIAALETVKYRSIPRIAFPPLQEKKMDINRKLINVAEIEAEKLRNQKWDGT